MKHILQLLLHASLLVPMDTPPPDNKADRPPRGELVQDVGDIDGIYASAGDERGKPYHGAVTIKKINEVYLVTWAMESNAQGIGIRVGDQLSVAWQPQASKGIGVTVYRIMPGPTLTGRWTGLPGNGQVHRETLKFLKAFPAEDD